MRAVGEAADVSAAAIYRHFENKDELWGEVVRETAALFRDYLFDGMEAPSPEERLWGALEAVRRFAVDEPKYYELLMLAPPVGGVRTYPQGYRENPQRTFRLLVDLVAENMANGALADDDATDVAITLVSHAHGLIRLYRMDRFGDDHEGFARFYLASFEKIFKGLA